MKPGVKTIVVGGAIFLLGAFVVPVALLLPLILEGSRQDAQFKVPGTIEFVVEKPGRYYLWNDFKTVFDGKSYARPKDLPDGMEIRIQDADGRPIQFVSDGLVSMSSGGNAKRSVGYVTLVSPGKLTINVSGEAEERIFSFAPSRMLRMFGLVLGGFGLSMIIAFTGVGIAILGIVRFAKSHGDGEPCAHANHPKQAARR